MNPEQRLAELERKLADVLRCPMIAQWLTERLELARVGSPAQPSRGEPLMLLAAPDSLQSGSNHGALAPASGATGQLIRPTKYATGFRSISTRPQSATTPNLIYCSQQPARASASDFDVAVTPTLPWDGMVGPGVWRGGVQYKWAGSVAANVSMAES